jgi:hypothetical protein
MCSHPDFIQAKYIPASAKRRASELVTSGRSLMKVRKSSGPRTVPCGTPDNTSAVDEVWPSRRTCARLFANDCLLYRPIFSRKDTEDLQQDLAALEDWEKQWQMAFHLEKCVVIQISSNRRASELVTSGRLLMKVKKSRGPRTASCGTPDNTSAVDEVWPSRRTCYSLLLRKTSIACKLLEDIVRSRVMDHCDRHNFLSDK